MKTVEKLNSSVVVTLDGRQISDLFFNHENKNYEAFCASSQVDDNLTEEQYQTGRGAALLKDAKEFAEMLGGQVDPVSLVEDFIARL